MPNMKRPSGTGNAPIIRQGQTASKNYAANPDISGPANKDKPRDLSAK